MTLTGLADALLKAHERLEPAGLITWERADAGRDRQGHLRGAPAGRGWFSPRSLGLVFTTSSELSPSIDRTMGYPCAACLSPLLSDAAITSDFSKDFILFLLDFLRLLQKNVLCLGSRDQQAISKATYGN